MGLRRSFLFALCVIFAGILHIQASSKPEQVHIAMAELNGMRVSWFMNTSTGSSKCLYGVDKMNLNVVASGSNNIYLANGGEHHRATLTDLLPATQYYYACGDDAVLSDVFSFTTFPPSDSKDKPISLAIFGDMGYGDIEMRPMGLLGHLIYTVKQWSATYSRNLLEKWKDEKAIDMVWHIGDIGYADDAAFYSLSSFVSFEYEKTYNSYMNWLQSLASAIPYHVVVGNHESECWDPMCILSPSTMGIPLSNFSAYNNRWAMPSAESQGTANMWYSFDIGGVHFTATNTETDWEGATLENRGPIFPAGHFAADGAYFTWLENDLAAAAKNPNVKWLVIGGHRSLQNLPDNIQALFVKYGVSLYVGGHIHSYARYPATNGITEILVGGPGCDDMQYSTDNPSAVTTNCTAWALRQEAAIARKADKDKHGDWRRVCDRLTFPYGTATSAASDAAVDKGVQSASTDSYFTSAYSIGKLTVANNGYGDELRWELYSSVDGSVLDSVVIAAK